MSAISLSQFLTVIVEGYKTDTQYSKALTAGVDSGIYTVDSMGCCIWQCQGGVYSRYQGWKGKSLNLPKLLISHAHEIVVHGSLD
jgi:hypothetical protein